MGLCDNRTIIITGAGGGLGRAYAIALGVAGGNVVVNDINPDTAAETVKIINDAGGQAIVNLDDITDYASAGKILTTTIEHFGDVHAVVNNAGNNRDRMFTSLTEDDWDDVIRVHLKGHFCLSSHAAKYWREKSKNGENPDARIINTSSGAGLQGSVGQTNYAAAKGGILTLTLNQSAELARYGITTNSVAPLIVYLCSPASADINGYCFEAFGGKLSIADGYKTGPIKDKEARYEPEEIEAVIRELIDITPPAQKVYGS